MTIWWFTVEPRSTVRATDWRRWPGRLRSALVDRTLPILPPHPETGAADDRMIAQMRCVIAVAALFILWIDPPHVRAVSMTYVALASFCAYSALTYLLATERLRFPKVTSAWSHWADLGWFTLLIGLSGTTQSILFIGYLFAILTASFRWGFSSGASVTVASVVLASALDRLAAPHEALELGRVLFRPVYLLVLGYMISYWGGFHVSMSARLRLLKDVTKLSNPRFGIDRTIADIMRSLRAFYRADACVLLMPLPSGDAALVWRCDAESADQAEAPTQIPLNIVSAPLSLDQSRAVVYTGVPLTASRPSAGDDFSAQLSSIAETLGARCFMTVPWPQPGRAGGRLYVTSRHAFEPWDLEFLSQIVDQVMPTLENVRLVDRLATDAAEAERLRIARDLHDSVVQPYIGIRMGLAAIRQKLRASQDVTNDLDHLDDVISLEIDDLRRYLRELKASRTSRGALVEALSRFADRFTDATGIALVLDVADPVQLNDRLAAEAFQMVVEAVSNVRRHTASREIHIRIRTDGQLLVVQVSDAGTPDGPPRSFIPRSISERATALGGHVHVENTAHGGSLVTIEIPL
jgi:signal transduction histidine kinase